MKLKETTLPTAEKIKFKIKQPALNIAVVAGLEITTISTLVISTWLFLPLSAAILAFVTAQKLPAIYRPRLLRKPFSKFQHPPLMLHPATVYPPTLTLCLIALYGLIYSSLLGSAIWYWISSVMFAGAIYLQVANALFIMPIWFYETLPQETNTDIGMPLDIEEENKTNHLP